MDSLTEQILAILASALAIVSGGAPAWIASAVFALFLAALAIWLKQRKNALAQSIAEAKKQADLANNTPINQAISDALNTAEGKTDAARTTDPREPRPPEPQ